MSYFDNLGLAEPILRALAAKNYTEPTPIQRQAIPPLMEGRDLLGIAQTGTGKTAAFALPSIHRLAAEPAARNNAACRMLVLSPTRELAAQIADNMRGYAKYLSLSVQCIFGGVPVNKQARALSGGCDVLVATPGRLLDLIDQRALTLRHVEIFVLDEADQMMDLGFIHALKRVSSLLPPKRQSLFFSATMPKAIAELGRQFINNPVRVEVTPQATTAERVEQFATHINQAEKQALLSLFLRGGLADGSVERALVFSRTKHGADRVVRHLSAAGVSCAAIHGNKSQGQRTAAITGFRKGDVPVLIATDIAARGIDIPGVSHVLNFEMPNVAEQYVHRIGRTARAGADGVAISYVAPDEKEYLRDIEKLTGIKLMPMPLPEDFRANAAKLPAASRAPEPESRPAYGRGRDERRHQPARAGEGRGGQGRGGESRGGPPRRSRDDAPRSEAYLGDAPRGDAPRSDYGRAPRRDELSARPQTARPESAGSGDQRGSNASGDRRFGEVRSAAPVSSSREGWQPRTARDDRSGGQPRRDGQAAPQRRDGPPRRDERSGGQPRGNERTGGQPRRDGQAPQRRDARPSSGQGRGNPRPARG